MAAIPPYVNTRKARAALRAIYNAVEDLADSNLRNASGDSLLLDDLNNLARRIVDDARRAGVEEKVAL